MSAWVETEAAALSELAKGDPERLLMLLEPGICVHDCPAGEACCVHWTLDRADVFAPPRDVPALLEEIGHALLTVGLGRRLAADGCPTARRQLMRDEAIARRFAARFGGGDG